MDNLVYARLITSDDLLAVCEDRILPVVPFRDSPVPYLYYWRVSTGNNLTLGGNVRPQPYTFAFDVWSKTQTEARAIQDAVYDLFNNWREDEVQGSFLQSDAAEQEELGYHIQSIYQIWY
jgi:hypothetical protein